MFGIGLMELLTILVLATLVMGPEGMVKFAGQLGQWLAKFRRETEGVTREFKEAFNLELNPKEFTDALDVGLDLKDPLGLKEIASAPAPQRTTPSARRWNLPTSTAAPVSAAAQAAMTAASAPTGPDDLDAGKILESELASIAEAETSAPLEPPVVDTSPDADAVMIGIAEWVPEDDKAEATVIGEPLWVDVADVKGAPGEASEELSANASDDGEQGNAQPEEVA